MADLTGQLTPLAMKRITKEKQRIEQESKELEKGMRIFTVWGDEINKAVAMIVGPEGTPYQHGFYFFDVQFSDNYPMKPPYVNFKTADGRVRFNPNLYVEGKVCLSILGTWSGPSWTSSCNFRTVLVSVQSLLSDHPIQNEPGHERESGVNDAAYTEIIRHENIAVAVVRMFKYTPEKFQIFRPTMRKFFLRHYEDHVKTLKEYELKDGTSTQSPIWGFQVKYRVKELLKELAELRKSLQKEECEAEEAEEVPSEKPKGAELCQVQDSGSLATSSSTKKRDALEAEEKERPKKKKGRA